MDTISYEFLNDTMEDISHYKISGHTISQYSLKCEPSATLVEICSQMRSRLTSVRRIELKNKEMKKGRIAYIDVDKSIYIVEKNKSAVITAYPAQRIFVARPSSRNKLRGYKYL